jgi:para-nitrobenzyl esterase
MVWIHGGGYVGGGTSIPIYDGSGFAAQGIVVVSFSYRLGRIGFFAHPALVAANEGYVGNYGLLDQIFALEWVRENIAAFGGDPDRVTLVGESAGGASVIHLMTSPIVGDLFHQAVVLSGGGREALIVRAMEDHSLLGFAAPTVDAAPAREHDISGDGPEALAALRELDPEILTGREDLEQLAKMILLGGSLTGVPVIDGEVIAGQPQSHFLDGTAKDIPIIIGSTAIDVPTVFPPSKLDPFSWFGEDKSAAREAYGVGDDFFFDAEQLVSLLLSIGSDMTMHEPAHFVASTMKEAGQPAWVYRLPIQPNRRGLNRWARATLVSFPFCSIP